MTVAEFIECLAPLPNAKLYHATQLRDFETYVQYGVIVSRATLFGLDEQKYTPFESDKDDAGRLNCAEDCFGNLLDQGNFSKNGKGIPNTYGPITLYFKPDVTIRSNATKVTVRRKAVWSSVAAYREELDCAGIQRLYNAAGYATGGEFQLHGGVLDLSDLVYVVVNPITVAGETLKTYVANLLSNVCNRSGRGINVYERSMSPDGKRIYEELLRWAADVQSNHGAYVTVPAKAQDAFAGLGDFKKSNLERFANYIEHGTLSRMRGVDGHLTSSVDFTLEYDERDEFVDDDYTRITELDTDTLFDRDAALHAIEVAEFRLQQARQPAADGDDDARAGRIELAWSNYGEATTDLNYWIEQTRNWIISGQDELHERHPNAHDGQLSANLGAWADEFEEIEFPYDDPSAPEEALVDWRRVRGYAESGW